MQNTGVAEVFISRRAEYRRAECRMQKTNETFYEYGVWELVQGKRTDWDYVHELVTSGKTASRAVDQQV